MKKNILLFSCIVITIFSSYGSSVRNPIKLPKASGKDTAEMNRGFLKNYRAQIFLGTNPNYLKSDIYKLNELGFNIQRKMNPNLNLCLELNSSRYIINELNIYERYAYRDENGILTGRWAERSEVVNGVSSLMGAIGIQRKIFSCISFELAATFSRNKYYNSKEAYINEYVKSGKNGGYSITSSNSGGVKVSESRFVHGNFMVNNDYGLKLGITGQYKKISLSLIYKQGLRDFTINSFFNNNTKNFIQYSGFRLSYDIFSFAGRRK